MADAFTSKDGGLFVQLGGPNPLNDVLPMKCSTVGDITETEAAFTLIRCHDPSGAGWQNAGLQEGPPEPVVFSIDELMPQQLSYLEEAKCPMAIYLMLARCGRHDIIYNYDRGKVLESVYRQAKTSSGLVHQDESNPSMLSVELWAKPVPEIVDVVKLNATRMTTAATNALNDAVMNTDFRCLGDCPEDLDICEEGMTVGDSAVAPAFATTEITADYGVTWTAAAADPFAAGEGNMSVVTFWVGSNTRRYLAGMEAPAAAQGMVAYTDDDGATWTTSNIGGAAAGHGVTDSGGLFALDHAHIWLVGAAGYIYFSDDGGETWTAQEAGVIHAGDYAAVHFADEYYGTAVGAADVVAVTTDGGETWEAGTATGGANGLTCVWQHDKNTIIVGDDGGELYCSNDGAVTWTQVTGWPGSGVGDIADIQFATRSVGWMVKNTAAPVGSILYTFTGGRYWQAVDNVPTNAGLNAVAACDESHAIVVGEVQGGTAMVLRVQPAA